MTRFAVSIVSPPGYVHSGAFREVGETLQHALGALGHDSILTDDCAPVGRRPIVLGSNLLPASSRPLAPDAILYNLEQVEAGSSWMTPALIELFRRHEIWDYSERNAGRYAELGLPRPRVVPIGYVPELTRIPPAVEDIDVLFYGCMNPRRSAVLQALRARGLWVEALFGVYGEERDRYIARAKLVLNVHFYGAKVFEIARVSYLLANRRCVVSERGADPSEEEPYEDGVAFARYEDLAETCAALAGDPATRRARAAAGFAAFACRPATSFLRQVVGGVAPPVAKPETPRRPSMLPPLPSPASMEDLLALAQPRGRRTLVVGCGEGVAGAALLQAGAAEVVGLEPRAQAVAMARSRLTAVYRVGVDVEPPLPYPHGYFDLAVVEDLSMFEDPCSGLSYLRRWLADDAQLVCVVTNPLHEATLARLLGEGRWPGAAGARPLSLRSALAAIEQAGFRVSEEAIAVKTDPTPTSKVLIDAIQALGGNPAAALEDLRLVRAFLTARPAAPAGKPAPRALADPWRGSKATKVLIAPDLSDPQDSWKQVIGPLLAGLGANPQVTVAVALPLPFLSDPPEAVRSAASASKVDFLLTEAPVDEAGWDRLLAGSSTWVSTSQHPLVSAAAARVGTPVQPAA